MSTREAAALLGIGTGDVAQLAQAGLLGRPHRVGNKVAFDRKTVEGMRWPPVSERHPAALVVRVRAAVALDGVGRPYMGYATNYGTADDEVTRRDAVRQWWPVRDPERVVGHPLVVTLAGFVVAVYAVTGFDRAPDHPRIAFRVAEAGPEVTGPFVRRRLTLPPGPVAIFVGATE